MKAKISSHWRSDIISGMIKEGEEITYAKLLRKSIAYTDFSLGDPLILRNLGIAAVCDGDKHLVILSQNR